MAQQQTETITPAVTSSPPVNRPEPGLYEASRGNLYRVLAVATALTGFPGESGDLLEIAHHVGPSGSGIPDKLWIYQQDDAHRYDDEKFRGEVVLFHPTELTHRLMFTSPEYFLGDDESGTPRFVKVG